MKILSIFCNRSFISGRASRDCSIQQAWLRVVGSTAGGVVFLRTAVLSWKVGGGSAGGQSPMVWFYSGLHYLSVGIVPAASDSMEMWVGEEP